MRCLSLRHDANSNDNGTDKREALREGKPSAEQMQGGALPLGEHPLSLLRSWVQDLPTTSFPAFEIQFRARLDRSAI